MKRRSFSPRTATRGVKAIHATSPKGLQHLVGTVGLNKQTKTLEKQRYLKESSDLQVSIQFWKWINAQPKLPFSASMEWNQPSFRLVWDDIPPLSIAGNLATGGRFNVGAAQVTKHITVSKQACLYSATTLDCCFKEAQPPIGVPKRYRIKPKNKLFLWDLEEVLRHYNDPLLTKKISDAPLDAIWELQKVPLISQLLATFLRSLGGNGIRFPSTKEPSADNLAFFFKYDKDVEAALEFIEI